MTEEKVVEVVEEEQELNQTALTVLDQARAVAIQSNDDYAKASGFLIEIKKELKRRIEYFKPLKQKIDSLKRDVLDREKAAKKPLDDAFAIVDPLCIAWEKEQERLRIVEERRLQAIADQKAEDEKLDRAALAEESGDKEEAEEILNEADFTPPVILQKATPKVQGRSFRKNYKFEILDYTKIDIAYLQPNEKAIDEYARTHKEQAKMAGVRFYAETISATRA